MSAPLVKESAGIVRTVARATYCPFCRLYCDEVLRKWNEKGEFVEDRCPKCLTKLHPPKKKAAAPWLTAR